MVAVGSHPGCLRIRSVLADYYERHLAMNNPKTESNRAESAWDHLADDGSEKRLSATNAASLAGMHAYYNRRIMGSDNTHYLQYFLQEYLQQTAPVVIGSFGAGGGHLERTLVEMGFPGAAIDAFGLDPRLGAVALPG